MSAPIPAPMASEGEEDPAGQAAHRREGRGEQLAGKEEELGGAAIEQGLRFR
ncbi:MAG: hypothetical protein U1E17_09220 [Geminicoccaceae bacterium]